MMARRNPFTKEYYTGRKDQYDIDYSIFRKAIEKTQTREEIAKLLDALKAKYSLQKSGEEFKLTKGLPPEGFETLKKAMMDAGYVYSRDSRSFRKEGVR